MGGCYPLFCVSVHFPFHFLLWSWDITFITTKKKKERKEVRVRGKKERKRKINLALLCRDIWQLRIEFCLRPANYLNIRTQETKQLKSY